MVESSKLCSFIKAVFRALFDSRIYKFLYSIVAFFADSFAASKTRKVLTGGFAYIEDYADTSVFYTALSRVWNAVIGFFVKVTEGVGKGADTSFFNKLFVKTARGTFSERYVHIVSLVSVFIFIIPHDFWSNTFGTLFAAVLFILYVMALSSCKEETRPGKNIKYIWLCTIVFAFSLLVSTFLSYDVMDSIRVLLFFITSYMLCFVIYASVKDIGGLNIITGFMYGALMLTSLLALLQRVMGVEADASLTDLALNEDMPGRVFSTMGNPNNFAEFLVLFMPFALVFALNQKDKSKRTGLLFGMLVPLAAILLTYSRSGWIALAIAAVVFVAMYDKRLIPVFVLLIIVAIPFIPENILNRILTIGNLEDTSSSYRVDIWTGCLKMLKDYWFTGVGLGTGGFAEIYPGYAVGESGVAPHSHMHFMEMLIELGALGFISYICMTFTLIKRSLLGAAKGVPKEIRNVAIASASSMTGIVLIGCFEYCWFYPRVMFAFFICAGVGMAAAKMSRKYISE